MTWYVVDGMDGCGKSTCADILKERLESKGRRVRMFSHPDSGCLFGRLEYGCLLKEGRLAKMLATVFFILDAVDSLLRMRLSSRRYDDFVFVRYLMSVAYLPDGSYRKAYRIIRKLFPMPDDFILVDVDAETSMKRIEARGEDREAFENMDDLVRTREKMLSLSDGWFVVDNTLPLEDVRRLIEDHVEEVVSRG